MIEIVSEPQDKVYVMACVPGPATVGSNTPVKAFTPVPLQVPPAVAAVRVIGESL
jgi:hypothetical protein